MATGVQALSLIDDLVAVPQREKGGSIALERLDYQASWAVSLVLMLHEKSDDYAVAFEFHDDIVVLNGSSQPTKARFYQVKTRDSGHWTVTRLTQRYKRRGGSDRVPSIVAKMYDNRIKFGSAAEVLGFVTNQPCEFIERSKCPCTFDEGDSVKTDALSKAIASEVPTFAASDINLFEYHLSDLPLSRPGTMLRGLILQFLECELGIPDCPSSAFVVVVLEHARERSKHMGSVTNFQDLMRAKALTRAQVQEMLDETKRRHQSRPKWSAVSSDLTGISPVQKRDIGRAWAAYEVDKLSRASLAFERFCTKLRDLVNSIDDNDQTLAEIVRSNLDRVRALAQQFGTSQDDAYLSAAFLYEFSS
ncbi:MAG: dsDNA nuclease domain-containing protein [Methylobacterium sp.]|nr:dsDNA nuclease domain-containing protein [Methylobacterium sp.]